MPAVTATLMLDLTGSGNLTTDITQYWDREEGFSLTGRGRQKEHDAAGMSTMVIRLDNRDGRFSPKNTGSPYYPNWGPYKLIQAALIFNSITYYLMTGIIAQIAVSEADQLCEVT